MKRFAPYWPAVVLVLAAIGHTPFDSFAQDPQQNVTIRGTIEGLHDPLPTPNGYLLLDPKGGPPQQLILMIGSQWFFVTTVPVQPPGPLPPTPFPTPTPTPTPTPPAPTPTPGPTPTPTPTVGPISVLLIWDASKETPAVAAIRSDLALQTAIQGLNASYRAIEASEPELNARNLVPYVGKAGGAPCVLVQDKATGKILLNKPLPATSADVLNLIKSLRGGQ